jgi:hypothetical protein
MNISHTYRAGTVTVWHFNISCQMGSSLFFIFFKFFFYFSPFSLNFAWRLWPGFPIDDPYVARKSINNQIGMA